eukprot:TRINITY_DN1069_c0_g3_i2.p1 TRINITY_DN1069_c0_g3~~TRINITY_DN1069_c0_g3_i2.p1  ORF type:complete len:666 (-),score=117.82 TRINITY_DN1069_c0_g3_i2:152-2149(-)
MLMSKHCLYTRQKCYITRPLGLANRLITTYAVNSPFILASLCFFNLFTSPNFVTDFDGAIETMFNISNMYNNPLLWIVYLRCIFFFLLGFSKESHSWPPVFPRVAPSNFRKAMQILDMAQKCTANVPSEDKTMNSFCFVIIHSFRSGMYQANGHSKEAASEILLCCTYLEQILYPSNVIIHNVTLCKAICQQLRLDDVLSKLELIFSSASNLVANPFTEVEKHAEDTDNQVEIISMASNEPDFKTLSTQDFQDLDVGVNVSSKSQRQRNPIPSFGGNQSSDEDSQYSSSPSPPHSIQSAGSTRIPYAPLASSLTCPLINSFGKAAMRDEANQNSSPPSSGSTSSSPTSSSPTSESASLSPTLPSKEPSISVDSKRYPTLYEQQQQMRFMPVISYQPVSIKVKNVPLFEAPQEDVGGNFTTCDARQQPQQQAQRPQQQPQRPQQQVYRPPQQQSQRPQQQVHCPPQQPHQPQLQTQMPVQVQAQAQAQAVHQRPSLQYGQQIPVQRYHQPQTSQYQQPIPGDEEEYNNFVQTRQRNQPQTYIQREYTQQQAQQQQQQTEQIPRDGNFYSGRNSSITSSNLLNDEPIYPLSVDKYNDFQYESNNDYQNYFMNEPINTDTGHSVVDMNNPTYFSYSCSSDAIGGLGVELSGDNFQLKPVNSYYNDLYF